MTDSELQSLRNLGGECETAANEIDRLRADLAEARLDNNVLREINVAQERDLAAARALLPGVYYMDPPDGGNVDLIEQLRRMATDAERYRWLRKHLPAGTINDFDVDDAASWDTAIDAALAKEKT